MAKNKSIMKPEDAISSLEREAKKNEIRALLCKTPNSKTWYERRARKLKMEAAAVHIICHID